MRLKKNKLLNNKKKKNSYKKENKEKLMEKSQKMWRVKVSKRLKNQAKNLQIQMKKYTIKLNMKYFIEKKIQKKSRNYKPKILLKKLFLFENRLLKKI